MFQWFSNSRGRCDKSFLRICIVVKTLRKPNALNNAQHSQILINFLSPLLRSLAPMSISEPGLNVNIDIGCYDSSVHSTSWEMPVVLGPSLDRDLFRIPVTTRLPVEHGKS
jgi:hypothetical protein